MARLPAPPVVVRPPTAPNNDGVLCAVWMEPVMVRTTTCWPSEIPVVISVLALFEIPTVTGIWIGVRVLSMPCPDTVLDADSGGLNAST